MKLPAGSLKELRIASRTRLFISPVGFSALVRTAAKEKNVCRFLPAPENLQIDSQGLHRWPTGIHEGCSLISTWISRVSGATTRKWKGGPRGCVFPITAQFFKICGK